eukprot:1326851-Amorphochlora_amoeboformis.AAC.1
MILRLYKYKKTKEQKKTGGREEKKGFDFEKKIINNVVDTNKLLFLSFLGTPYAALVANNGVERGKARKKS